MPVVLHIKNMVCPRCIAAVRQSLQEADVAFDDVTLGEVRLPKPINTTQRSVLGSCLEAKGFEILEDKTSTIINDIKSAIIEQVHYNLTPLKQKFSIYLAERLHKDYSSLSKLFSSVEGITIEKFISCQKIERAKELLIYDQLSLSQIAHEMNYSSVAHLSAQFKRETGLTPTAFKKLRKQDRKPLDQI